ncbi:MAG: Porphobilinogen deaminase [Fusobacteria bacterium]|nr:MAG: Porphobilinogen deaminase [Fusobacteriota bacterium]KAF0230181.1 MAG: Porphobilinogen [Fusobacteriota bacterium]
MFFPIFIDIKMKKIFIIGGGLIALRKAVKLLDYQPRLTIISPAFHAGFLTLEHKVELIMDDYKKEYIADAFMVIAATDSSDKNNEIYNYCNENQILCNKVESGLNSDFYIPGIVKKGDLQIVVSTNGKSPILTRRILKRIDNIFGNEIQSVISYLGEERKNIIKLEHNKVIKRRLLKESVDRIEGDLRMKVIIGSRGSKLALAQCQLVTDDLKRLNPNIDFEIKIIISKGDLVLDKQVSAIGGKGVFVKEIEEALLNGEIDLAVHSMKDLPTEDTSGLVIAGVPKREDYRDALILRIGLLGLDDVPIGGKIGTGSKRRAMQIKHIRPDLNIVPLRGNVDTRINKLDNSDLDGIILAAAGLKRLGLEQRITSYFSVNEMLPAPAQGALAMQVRAEDDWLKGIVEGIIDKKATLEVETERTFLSILGGDCNSPAGALCQIEGANLTIQGIYSVDGINLIKRSINGSVSRANDLASELAKEIRKNE